MKRFWGFLIILVCFASAGRIVNYYFYYDDFFLFYALQFPEDKNSIFNATDASGYNFLQPFFGPLFHLFGYNPRPYFIISFLLFLFLIFPFYLFLKIIFPKNPKVALFSSLIFASGYVGVEALTWNMGAGPNNTVFLTSSFLSLFCLAVYVQKKKNPWLWGFVLSFIFTVYFFQFRAFLLFLWVALLVLFFTSFKKPPWQLLLTLLATFTMGTIFYNRSFSFNKEQGLHLDFTTLGFVQIYLRNFANIILPTEVLGFISDKVGIAQEKTELVSGSLIFTAAICAVGLSLIRKLKEARIILFFSTSLLLSLFILQAVLSMTVATPTVWYSAHRFWFVINPFVAGLLGTLFAILYDKKKLVSLTLLCTWLASHVYLSNIAITQRWENPISHIRYFYTTLKADVPRLDNNSVLLVTQGEPTPVSVFVSARDANALAQVSGFYGKTTDQLNLALSPIDAVSALNRLGVSADKLYVFHYRRGELLNITNETREILKEGRTVALKVHTGKIVEFNNLYLPTSAPLYLGFNVLSSPDLLDLDFLDKPDQENIKNTEDYFRVLFKQNARKKPNATSSTEPLSFEHEVSNVIDGDYATTWIPKNWDNDGVSIIVNLGMEKKVSRLAWSSSRTASWMGRLPSEYTIETSHDGKKFSVVRRVVSPMILKTGDFFVDNIDQVAKYIKITVNKTRGGLTPAIDEVDVFEETENEIDLRKYFLVKQNPERYFSNTKIARSYLKEVLNDTINLEIAWRVDGNTDYPEGRSMVIPVAIGRREDIFVNLPIGIGKDIKSIRIRPQNFPATVDIKKAMIIYPKLQP